MKVFPTNLYRLQAGSPVTPEVYNTNISNLADANNDIASKRYTRWSTVYQYSGYNNTFSSETLKFKIPESFGMTSGISLNQPTFDAVGVLTAGSYSDIKFSAGGGKLVLLGTVGGVTTFVTYTMTVNNDISTIVNTPVINTISNANFTNVKGFCFSQTGLKLYTITQAIPSVIKEHALSVAYDISTVNTTPTTSLASASNNLNYISFNIDLQFLNSGGALYYGAKGATTLITRLCATRYVLSTAGAESVITPAPADPIYGVHVAEDGSALTTRFRTALTLVDYAAGAGFIRAHANRTSDIRNDVFLIASYRNLKTYNLIVPNAFAVNRLGTDCLNMSTNGLITGYALKTPFLLPPSVGIERIIVAGYYTAANPITLTVTGNGLSDTYNITLPASTDALERRFDFDGKKIKITPSVTSTTPTLNLASTGVFSISKLDVELHFISDRLANQLSNNIIILDEDTNPNGIIELKDSDIITENELVLASKINTSKLKFAKLNRQNINCDSSFRWLHYSAINISSAAAHIFEIPPTRNINNSNNINTYYDGGYSNQVITGFYIAVSTMAGGVLNIADTITINSGNNFKQTVNFTATNNQQIKFQPTISGVLPAPYYGSAEQIVSSLQIGADWNTRFFTITTTTALLLKVQVYVMYA